MFFLLSNLSQYIVCELFEQCELPSRDGYVLTKYYRETCPHCQRLTPLIEEIDNRLERHGLTLNVHSIECQKCDCSRGDIDAVPTVILSKDNKELGRFKGYRDYEFIVDFLTQHMGINKKILTNRLKNIPGKVVKLKQSDFFTAFEGPWIILFYDKDDDIRRELIKEIADVYAGKVMVGEVTKSETKTIEHLYNIVNYPTVVGTYSGLTVHYSGDNNLPGLIDFADRLVNPSFEEINLEKFNEIRKDLNRGDSIFIVFYTDVYLANSYFKEMAHEFKFKAKIYKSSDKELFEFANIFPSEHGDGGKESTVILTNYRNEVFHKYPNPFSKIEELYNWIFYAHYPHVSKVNNSNFNSLFYGVKPLIIFLTIDDRMVDKFEMLSVERHMGVPFAKEIFAVFDMKEFQLFGKLFFGNYKCPGLIIFDPTSKKLYGENRKITEDNFHMEAHRMLRNHDAGKIKIYKSTKGHKLRYFITTTLIFLVLIVGYGYINTQKYKNAKNE